MADWIIRVFHSLSFSIWWSVNITESCKMVMSYAYVFLEYFIAHFDNLSIKCYRKCNILFMLQINKNVWFGIVFRDSVTNNIYDSSWKHYSIVFHIGNRSLLCIFLRIFLLKQVTNSLFLSLLMCTDLS